MYMYVLEYSLRPRPSCLYCKCQSWGYKPGKEAILELGMSLREPVHLCTTASYSPLVPGANPGNEAIVYTEPGRSSNVSCTLYGTLDSQVKSSGET